MNLNIVIRAADPVRAAELFKRLGIELEEPNRPNPTRWHAWCRISISVEQCGSGEEPGLALALPDPERALSGASSSAILERAGSRKLLNLGGAAIPFIADSGPVEQPAADQALLAYAETILQHVRRDLASILTRHRLTDVRLGGPSMLGHGVERCFTLVVGGCDEATIAELRSLFEANALPTFRIDVVAPEGLDPEVEERLGRLAWDLDP